MGRKEVFGGDNISNRYFRVIIIGSHQLAKKMTTRATL